MPLRYNRVSGKWHGYSSGKKGHAHLYAIWSAIRNRCFSPKNKCYKNYGGRGISVCPEWDYYPVFREWALVNGYKESLTIDRYDTNGDYSPSNCHWITMKENLKKRSVNKFFIYGDVVYTLLSLSERIGINYNALYMRIRRNGEQKTLQWLKESKGLDIKTMSLSEIESKRLKVA